MVNKPQASQSTGKERIQSMLIDKQTVQKIANLAAIEVKDEELEKYSEQLSKILSLAEELSEVDTDNIEPLANVSDITLRLREDVVSDGNVQSEVLENAPEETEGYFVVQKIVE